MSVTKMTDLDLAGKRLLIRQDLNVPIKGGKVRFYGARLLGPMAGKEPGEIVEIKEGRVVVALKGGALGIAKVKDAAGAKMDAAEFAKSVDLKAGMKFGT